MSANDFRHRRYSKEPVSAAREAYRNLDELMRGDIEAGQKADICVCGFFQSSSSEWLPVRTNMAAS